MKEVMPKGRYKIKNGLVPIENHCTPWAEAESIKADSKVNLPNETQIEMRRNMWILTKIRRGP